MQKMKYENKLKQPNRVVKVRGKTVTLVWSGHDWIVEKLTAPERKARAKDGE